MKFIFIKKKIYKMCYPKWSLGLPVLLRWPWMHLKRDGMHQKWIHSNDSDLTSCIWFLKQVQIFLSDTYVEFLISQPWWFSEMVQLYAFLLTSLYITLKFISYCSPISTWFSNQTSNKSCHYSYLNAFQNSYVRKQVMLCVYLERERKGT
jgi:hypothetical protein